MPPFSPLLLQSTVSAPSLGGLVSAVRPVSPVLAVLQLDAAVVAVGQMVWRHRVRHVAT